MNYLNIASILYNNSAYTHDKLIEKYKEDETETIVINFIKIVLNKISNRTWHIRHSVFSKHSHN